MAQAQLERLEHPLVRRNYRVATAAIEAFADLVERCLRVLIPGALIYARPRCLRCACPASTIGSIMRDRSSARCSSRRAQAARS